MSGRHLYDPCGEKVVLRGVNEMVVWSAGRDGAPEFGEIAKTGANAVRIVWNETGSAAELDRALSNAVAAELLPIVEHHGATGNLAAVPAVVDYWVREDVVAVLSSHAAHLLLNVANEAGDGNVTAEAYLATYRDAIDRLRAAGLDVPLVLDAPSWGQDIDMLQAAGPTLIEHDPRHNLLLSVHMWWNDPNGARVKRELAESVAMELPLIVGEFAQHAVYQCDQAPFAFEVLLDEAAAVEVGWLAWSWGGVANADCADQGRFDMTLDGRFGNFTPWGEQVAISHPNGIQHTSRRPRSLSLGRCP